MDVDDVTAQTLTIQKQYEDMMREIENIVAEFPELADMANQAILLLTTKSSLEIESVYEKARDRLKEITSEAGFPVSLMGMDKWENNWRCLRKN